MKIAISWLKEFLSPLPSVEKLAEILTLSGIEVEGIYTVADETLLEVAITPNFGHAMSVLGIAREIAAHIETELTLPKVVAFASGAESAENYIEVEVEAREQVSQYHCCALMDLAVTLDAHSTPAWMRERLESIGMRSVNLVVDVVNYVMVELGIPLHAFDYDTIKDHKLNVRLSRPHESIVTLDHVERLLPEGALIIADAQKPLAIAGVMGAEKSEVGVNTRSILLEGAHFSAAAVRYAAKQLEISTEASRRFERGIDPEAIPFALERALFLILEGVKQQRTTTEPVRVMTGLYTTGKPLALHRTICCSQGRINSLLGLNLSMSEIETLLRRLGFKVSTQGVSLSVEVPSYRNDVKEEIDLIEEVARLYGYNHLYEKGEKRPYRGSTLAHHPHYRFERSVRRTLIAEGLTELLSCDLIADRLAKAAMSSSLGGRLLVQPLNPHSHAQSVLRPTLLVNHLEIVKHNVDHSIRALAGFEVGRIHFQDKGSYCEPIVAAVTLYGHRAPSHFDNEASRHPYDFLDLKGILENLLVGLRIPRAQFVPSNHSAFHPGRQAKLVVEGIEIGIMGEVHPHLLKEVDLKEPLLFAELSCEQLAAAARCEVKMVSLPTLPSSSRDWTVRLKEEVAIGDLCKRIEQAGSVLLESYELLDIFRSDKIGVGWKNVTLHFVFRSREETISQELVESEFERIKRDVEGS